MTDSLDIPPFPVVAKPRSIPKSAASERPWVAAGLFGLCFVVFGLIAYDPSLADNKLFFALAVSTWNGGLLLVASFFFGSSSGSQAKDDTIATMAKGDGS